MLKFEIKINLPDVMDPILSKHPDPDPKYWTHIYVTTIVEWSGCVTCIVNFCSQC